MTSRILWLACAGASAALLGVSGPSALADSGRAASVRPGFVIPHPAEIRRLDRAPSSVTVGRLSSRSTPTTTQAALVAAPPVGPPRSTWQVTYSGFAAYPRAQAAFQAAVDIWARIIPSNVPIKVSATFAALPSGVLGSAGSSASYPYVGDGQSYYPSALADAISGVDQSPLHPGAPGSDITATFSSSAGGFYFGTDGATTAGTVDFESVVLHELGHGLGFAGSMEVSNGIGSFANPPDRFDRFTYSAQSGGSGLLSALSSSLSLGNLLQSQSVYWGGPLGIAANGGTRPKMYSPWSWESGSSYSHLDEATYGAGDPNSLMTPAIGAQEVIHNPGPLTLAMLDDLGWQASLPSTPTPAPVAWPRPTLSQSSSHGHVVLTVAVAPRFVGRAVVFFVRSGLTGRVRPLGSATVDASGHARRALDLSPGTILAVYSKLLASPEVANPYSFDITFRVR